MKPSSSHRYCAFCRSERVIYQNRHVSGLDVVLAFAAATLLSFIIWQDLDPRLIVFFVFALGLAELFIVLRWRLSIACPKCGFDPVLYKKNRELAATRVREFATRRKEDPLSGLLARPNVPFLVKKKTRRDSSGASASSNKSL